MAFLLGFFVGPVIDQVGKVITNTGGMMFGDKERESKFNNIVERLKNLNTAIEAKVIQAHKKKHKENSIFSKPLDNDDDDENDNSEDHNEENSNGGGELSKDDFSTESTHSNKKINIEEGKSSSISIGTALRLKRFGKKMHAKLKDLSTEDVRTLSKFDEVDKDEDLQYDRPLKRKNSSVGGNDDNIFDNSCCDFFNPCCTFMRDNCEFYGCIEETTREVVVNVDTMGKEFRSNVETIRTTVAGTGISDFDDPSLFPDICPMFTNFDKNDHGDVQQFAHDLKEWFYTDKNEGLSKLGRDYHMDLMMFDERLEKIETAYEIKFASDNQRNMNIIKSKLEKIESMLVENNRNWIITRRYYLNIFSVLFVFHIIFHLMVHGELDINPLNDIQALQKYLKPVHR